MDVRYTNKDFQFFLRVSALIFNKDESKVLLFNVKGRKFYMLPGGKVNELEESVDAVKREIKEELGWDNLDYTFFGVNEEFVDYKGYKNHQIELIYKAIYKGEIIDEFDGLEGEWIRFKWIDINKIDDYEIYPSIILDMIKKPNEIHHGVDNLLKTK